MWVSEPSKQIKKPILYLRPVDNRIFSFLTFGPLPIPASQLILITFSFESCFNLNAFCLRPSWRYALHDETAWYSCLVECQDWIKTFSWFHRHERSVNLATLNVSWFHAKNKLTRHSAFENIIWGQLWVLAMHCVWLWCLKTERHACDRHSF